MLLGRMNLFQALKVGGGFRLTLEQPGAETFSSANWGLTTRSLIGCHKRHGFYACESQL